MLGYYAVFEELLNMSHSTMGHGLCSVEYSESVAMFGYHAVFKEPFYHVSHPVECPNSMAISALFLSFWLQLL